MAVETRLRNIPDDLWWKFKAAVALNKKRINDTLIEMIEEYVEKSGIERNGKLK